MLYIPRIMVAMLALVVAASRFFSPPERVQAMLPDFHFSSFFFGSLVACAAMSAWQLLVESVLVGRKGWPEEELGTPTFQELARAYAARASASDVVMQFGSYCGVVAVILTIVEVIARLIK